MSRYKRQGAARQRSRLAESLEPRALLAGDLVAQWRAESLVGTVNDGQTVTIWRDTVGNREARADGAPTLDLQSLGGRAVVRFQPADGNDALTVAPAMNPLSGVDDFSVAVAFRTDSAGLQGNQGAWFENTGLVDANQLGFGRDWGVTLNQAGAVGAGISGGITGSPATIYSTANGLNDGNSHVVVFTRAAGTLSLYVDGQLSATTTNADAQTRSPSGLAIGSLLTRAGYFSGDIAEVRLYRGSLTAPEALAESNSIQAFYNNRAPVAVNDVYAVDEDAPLFFVPKQNGVLVNDQDPDGDVLTATLVTPPSFGTLQLNPDGSFLYDSNANFNGTDTFTYTANDFRPGETATVTINVRPVYDPVQTRPDVYMLRPGEVLQVSGIVGLLANDGNPDRAALRAVLGEAPAAGELTLQPDGGFRYDPQGFAGRTSFTYRVDDGTQLSAPTTVSLAVTTPPTANADLLTTPEDQPLVIFDPAQGVLANDTDPEGDSLSVILVAPTTIGSLTLNANGSLVYTPVAEFHGDETFTYKVTDGFDESPEITSTIRVLSVNDAPLALADGYVSLPNATLAIPADRGVLANDLDIDGPSLLARLASPPAHGTLELADDGSFVYVPDVDFQGTDRFTYRASDGIDATEPIAVSLGISAQPLVINELLANNLNGLKTRTRLLETDRFRGENLTPDWIEIKNTLDFAVDVGGLHLTDDADDLVKWSFPGGTIIEPQGVLLVFASGADVSNPVLDENGKLHTNFSLASDGEYLAITAPDGTVLHSIRPEYPEQRVDISYGLGGGALGYFVTPTPGAENEGTPLTAILPQPTIERDHGFYREPIEVTIANPDPQAVLRYTLDGSTPSDTNGQLYAGPITIGKTTVLRAGLFRDGYLASTSDTRSYIFLADVVKQSTNGAPPEGWPTRWGTNATDYGMDPDIVNSAVWGPQLEEALTQIPSMSIVIDLPHMFDSRTGIYSHPGSDGIAWERPASLELVNPDGSQGFQQNIGLRIRGGFSRSTDNPKHAFRVFFDSPYGEGWLNFPLFDQEGASSFAKVDLRTAQNYSWAFQNDNRNTFLRDIFSRDLQGEMGHQYTRGRFYHLYLNGQYFGLFQTDERPEANFGASYYGGDPDDYDVIHNDPRANGATNGNLEAYRRLWEHFVQTNGLGDVNMEDYYRVQGMNPDGSRNPAYERLLDVDNLIDYMIITYYTSDADGPGSKFTRPGLNNYFTIFNRENPDGFKFFEHDSEHSLDTGNAAGANYNMVSPLVNNGRTFPQFNPHWMHEQLANSNSDYLIRFQDRVAELFRDDGILGDENVFKILDTRAAQIDKAIIAESARWGDAKRPNQPYTKTDWDRAVANIKRWVTGRTATTPPRRQEVLTQLSRERWWNLTLSSPQFSQHGGQVDPGFALTVNLTGDGEIYVTTDGSDPRASGGGINPLATRVVPGGQVVIQTGGTVQARTWNGTAWSPVTAAAFTVEPLADLNSLRISEVHYNPAAPSASELAAGFTDNDDFEFIELVNVSNRTIDLTGAGLQQVNLDGDLQGVAFSFAEGKLVKLAPGERMVVAENSAAFEQRYGTTLPLTGQWIGGLGNGGESIRLAVADGSSHTFAYDDGWYPQTDGGGASLEIVSPGAADLSQWNSATAWAPSSVLGGTPGSAGRLPGDITGDGVFDEADLLAAFQAGKYEDGANRNASFAEGDWNGDGDFTTADLVYVFRLGLYRDPAAAAALRVLPSASTVQLPPKPDLEPLDAALAAWDGDDPPRLLDGLWDKL